MRCSLMDQLGSLTVVVTGGCPGRQHGLHYPKYVMLISGCQVSIMLSCTMIMPLNSELTIDQVNRARHIS